MFIPTVISKQKIDQVGKLLDKNLVWWDKESIFYWPYVMYTDYPYSKMPDLRENENMGSDMELFYDPWDFYKYEVSKEDIFDWQVENGNINFCLGMFQDKDVVFENVGWYSKKIEEYTKLGKINKQKFVLTSQSSSMERCQVEIDPLLDFHENFKVISIPYNFFDYWGLLSAIMYWYEKLEGYPKDMHLSGFADSSIIPVLSYIKTFWKGRVTFDSSNIHIKDKHYTFGIVGDVEIFSGFKSIRQGKFLPCLCPYCSLLRNTKIKITNKNLEVILFLHNLHRIVNKVEFWDYVSREDEKQFRELVKKSAGKPSYDYLEFVDRCLNYGWERAVKSFWWVTGSEQNIRRRKRETEMKFNLACFGNFMGVCKDKCNYWKQCKKVGI